MSKISLTLSEFSVFAEISFSLREILASERPFGEDLRSKALPSSAPLRKSTL
ncbi:protein of unknown function [Streptomyces sp. KY75]|nr:protein of unknown function [Streptomyces sp. KY75]CAD5980912.1 protein of unknown function [Streptomyces sp. KY70]